MRITCTFVDVVCAWCIFVMPYAVRSQREPEIVAGPRNETTYVDRNLTLRCKTTGDPPPTVQWQKRNGTGGRWVAVLNSKGHLFIRRNTGELVFSRLLASDAGWYRCSAENARGSAFSASASLTIHAKAEIVRGPKDATEVWGREVQLECEVVGIPLPTRSWLKDGVVVVDALTSLPNSQPRLRVNATENATYTCMAENVHRDGYTNVSKSARLRVFDAQCSSYSGSLCGDVVEESLVYNRVSVSFSVVEATIREILNSSGLTGRCHEALRRAVCRSTFPECSGSRFNIRPKPLCSEVCSGLRESCLPHVVNVSSNDWFPLPSNCSMLPSSTDSMPCSVTTLFDDKVDDTNHTSEMAFDFRTHEPQTNEFFANEVKIAVFVVAPVSLVVLIIGAICAYKLARLRRRAVRREFTATAANSESIEIDISRLPLNDAYALPQSEKLIVESNPLLDRFEFERNGLQYCEDLRTGAFGPVFVAHALKNSGGDSTTPPFIVVKALRSDASEEARADFLRIAATLARLVHPSIVRLLGVCSRAEPLCVIVEFMPGRDLSEYLRESAPQHFIVRHGYGAMAPRIRNADQIGAARQVADAMCYVASQGFVHRDIAARNCLVGDPHSSPLIVKLSDFGLAVDLAGRDFHVGDDDEEIPIRWMPPESIQENRFTTASDVWSFGVLMWEIFTFGGQPYDQMTAKQVIRYVVGGRTLHCPEHASSAIYDLMRRCWQTNAADRPPFALLHEQLLPLEDLARIDMRA